MQKFILIILYFLYVYSIVEKERFPYGIYNFFYNNKQYLTYEKDIIKISFSEKINKNTHLRIIKLSNNNYHIENLEGNLKLFGKSENLKFSTKENSQNLIDLEWSFIELNNNRFIIRNKNGCYISLANDILTCKNNIKNAIKLEITLLYEEVHNTEEEIKLIEEEPIDVFIKFIDLTDPTLVREGISQIVKDESNDELKYSIRSILKNIPWVRKIFVVMPNEKVKYFKDYELIKDKIVYVKDKDLIGFDSSNIAVFQFLSWKMTKFNMSDNFLLMDDDYFIGKPLKKTDFFYVKDGKVVPLIVTNDFIKVGENLAKYNKANFKKRMKVPQSPYQFKNSAQNVHLFNLKIFNKSVIFPDFTHNAIPCNIKEVKEIYDLVYNSEYRANTLESLFRGNECLMFQVFYLDYTFNRFNKKVNNVPHKYIDVDDVFSSSFNYSLFCINTGHRKYRPIAFEKMKIAMNYYFPEPTPYEIINYISIPNISYNIIYQKENEKNKLKKVNNITIITMVIIILVIFYVIYKKIKYNN